MAAAYLYLNAALYAVFAVWCTVSPASTARNIGYTSLSSGGRSEYLVIYGGLQLGLAALFWILARNPATLRLWIQISIGLYAPIVLYRIITVIRFWPVTPLTAGTGILELSLLVAALAILVKGPYAG
jgi:hypothetical protein